MILYRHGEFATSNPQHCLLLHLVYLLFHSFIHLFIIITAELTIYTRLYHAFPPLPGAASRGTAGGHPQR